MQLVFILLGIFFFSFAKAEIKIVTTYPYIASITKEITKNKAKVDYLADGKLDPHFVIPKPSLAVKLRDADLLIINGAGLEVGWLPPLLNQASNSKINPNTKGFLDLSNFVELIEKPENVSRSMGDVHPEGNPHFYLNPNNIPLLSDAITKRLCILDSINCNTYKENNENFKKHFNEKIKQWNIKMSKVSNVKVIEYHKLFDYFLINYNIKNVGTIEPLPGIPPSAKHLENLIEKVKAEKVSYILQDVYHSNKPAQYISEKTGIKMIILPHDVYALPEVKDIFSLFDTIVERLAQ